MPLRWLLVVIALILLSACSSPDRVGDDDEAQGATSTATQAAGATPTATLPPTATLSESPPSPTVESSATPTDIPAPTATSTSAPPTPGATAVQATSTPTSPPPASEDDVWSVRQFDIDEPIMVLTFDAGADRGFTSEILDILAAEGIPASFGMTGPWAEDNLDLLARIVDEGHHLINHSWSHPHFPELTSEERIAEVQRLETLIRDEVGVETQPYFRPPFGEYDEATLADLASIGYTVNVMWTVDTLGWNGLSAEEINARVMDTAAPGGIVLMHVGAQSQDAAALPEMIRLLREQGYSFATIEDLAGR